MKYIIKTFGCQQNKADSERVKATYKTRGFNGSGYTKLADFSSFDLTIFL